MYRQESDSVGVLEVPIDAYYGVNAYRAFQNFQITNQKLHPLFIESLVEVKKAAALANMELKEIPYAVGKAIVQAADEMLDQKWINEMIVDPIQGGAGTSANMNINEVLANRAIELLGGQKGDYTLVNPNDHVNCGQSTNDVFPTAGKMTFLKQIAIFAEQLSQLEHSFAEKAKQYENVKKMGRTQLSDAVPITVGAEFNAYRSVTQRNLRRLLSVQKEIEYINLGGTAIGTGISAHPDFSEKVVQTLRQISGLEINLAEDLVDATQNVESFAVLSDVLKTIAISTSKIANDIRLLSSGPRTGIGELEIPAKQNGSSIMPGKINPVIPEVLTQCAYLVVGNNTTVSMAVESGQLELNAFEPVMFYKIMESFEVLTRSFATFNENCVKGIKVNEQRCHELLENSTCLTTPLAHFIGYKAAAQIAHKSLATQRSVREVALDEGVSSQILEKINL